MAQAVGKAIASGEHLAVQAGTGTGKSVAYLVPAIRHAVTRGATVVVSTATIALQRQLVDRDLPRLATALAPLLGRAPTFAILKGRRNYLCLNKLHGGPDVDPGDELFDPFAVSALGRQVKRIHGWADGTETGDRDELVPGVPDATWRQVSVSARECLGVARCPVGEECFAERARARAGRADVVVTNHALLAIDAMDDRMILPEHDVVIVDEAHELVDRVTGVATSEITAAAVTAAARRCGRLVDQAVADRLAEAGEGLGLVLEDLPVTRWDALPQAAAGVLSAVRDAAGQCRTGAGRRAARGPGGGGRPQDRRGGARRGRRDRRAAARRVRRARAGEAPRRRVARRAGTGRGALPDPAGRAPVGRRAAAGAALRPHHRRAHLGDAGAGWHVRRARPAVGAAAGEGGGRGRAERPRARPGRAALVGPRRRLPVPARPQRDPLRRAAPASPGPRRPAACLPRRDRRAGRGRRRTHARAVLLHARGEAGDRGAARAARHATALPGRRRHDAAGPAVRRRPGHLAVRDAVAVAGRRRARPLAVTA